ncbi:periplasmic L-asparaginase [Marinicauda pacifica]|uniref:Nuclear transport factor 2 family protein n=1 Tax=Marinicauda pacifica TaxID=1133559 RepID=A0A4S2HDX1_9PROT|nr:nuclear transport factor 2 family protein [Marinicauda pacifica]TGY94250.1 nuclear transport factor 2 family protein [Marinicauda pacifica]GGE34217.1 periplasmic L-asparaginase [Marinicauda pacifica]
MDFLAAILALATLQTSDCQAEGLSGEEICAVISAQQDAWNAGDIEGFMAGYWQDEALRFASGGTVTHGWQPTLERYLARYDTADKMGRLVFSDVDVTLLSETAGTAFGRWTLEREADRPTGLFTLVFELKNGEWVIVHDHTSAGDAGE